jgi:hypothetical protein
MTDEADMTQDRWPTMPSPSAPPGKMSGAEGGARRGEGLSRRDLLMVSAASAFAPLGHSATATAEAVETPEGEVRHSLDGDWKFHTDPYNLGEGEEWFAPGHRVGGWDEIAVPGVWDVINDYSGYAGIAWYRTEFATRPEWAGKRVRLVFEGVYNDAKVWLNGRVLGGNDMGYFPFHFDLQTLAPSGGLNQLTVMVDNRFRLGAVWNWGGIRRPVWLEITDQARLERLKIAADPDLDDGTATVSVSASASSAANVDGVLGAELTITHEGVVLHRSPILRPFRSQGGRHDFEFSVHLDRGKVDLWRPSNPSLYEARVRLFRQDAPCHGLVDSFGIRKVEVSGEQLLLNGEPVRGVGFNLVPEDRRTGSVLPPSRFRADVDRMKMLGATIARLSHFPLPRDFLDHLDRKGVLCISEVPIWGKSELVNPASERAAAWLERLITEQYNHPAIIGWSVGNEIGRFDRNPAASDYVRSAVSRARELDPRRLAVYASNSAPNQPDDPVKFTDLILLNAYNADNVPGGIGEAIRKTRALHPGKPIFLSEYGGGLDAEDPNLATHSVDAFLGEMRHKPYVIGASLWTLADYRSSWPGWPYSPPTAPSQNRSWGVLTVDRRPKRSYFACRAAHAPVAGMTLGRADRTFVVTLTPRDENDLPAYVMRGYRLLWRALDGSGRVIKGGLINVPVLAPGGGPVQLDIKSASGLGSLLVDLIDPLGYSLLTAKSDLAPPSAPAIRSVHTSSQKLRVTFDAVACADEYVALVRSEEGELRTEPTIDTFIEIANLKLGKTYDIRLVATNGAGESPPGPVRQATTSQEDPPPVLWSIQAADRALFLNYSTEAIDYLYDVEVTSEATGVARTISVDQPGVTRIPHLENGARYRVRMRRRNGLGNISGWTEPQVGVPRGPGGLPAPSATHLVSGTDGAMLLLFEPVENAAGYEVRSSSRTIIVDAAVSGSAFLRDFRPRGPVTLCAVDDFGLGGAAAEVLTLR